MTSLLLGSLALTQLLLAAPAGLQPADPAPLTVDTLNQVVQTDHFRIDFDLTRPDMIRYLAFKDRDTFRDLANEENTQTEFWGQSMQGTATPGFIRPAQLIEIQWQVDQQSTRAAQISTRTLSENQPPVLTRYWFYADKPYFVVERTIQFSQHPYTGAYQDYVPRTALLDTYRAIRFRDTAGELQQRGYCYTPCVQQGWDGRWLQHVGYKLGRGQSIATIYPASVAPGTPFVRGYGPNTFAGWATALWDSALHSTDETHRVLIAFSTQPDQLGSLDSLWTAFNSGAITLDTPAPAPRAAGGLRLSVAPNPTRRAAQVTWALPRAQRARVDVLDVSGRRVATLFEGDAPAGEMRMAWDGRDAGHEAAPGLYWARLTTPDGVRTRTIVRVQ